MAATSSSSSSFTPAWFAQPSSKKAKTSDFVDTTPHWQRVSEWIDEQTQGELDVDVIERFIEKVKLVSKKEWRSEGDAEVACELRRERLEYFNTLALKGPAACAPVGFDIFEEDISGGGLFYLLTWGVATDKQMHRSTLFRHVLKN